MENKKSAFPWFIIALICILLVLGIGVYSFYKTNLDIAKDHNDEFDYELNIEHAETNYDVLDFVSYDNSNKFLHVNIPKEYLFEKVIDIRSLNADLQTKYNIGIKRIGLISRENDPKIIDVSLDLSYKNKLNIYYVAKVCYELNDNKDIEIKFLGTSLDESVPEFVSKLLVPYQKNDVIYTIKTNDLDLLKENTLSIENLQNINITREYAIFEFDIISSVKTIITDIFGEDANKINNYVDALGPILLEILLGEDSANYLDSLKELAPYLIEAILNEKADEIKEDTPTIEEKPAETENNTAIDENEIQFEQQNIPVSENADSGIIIIPEN